MVQERKGEDGMKDYDERLRTLQEQAARKTRLEAKLAEVNRQKKMLQEKEEEWEKKAAREQRDVEQLEGASLSSLYYAIIGKKGEKLDKEKAEAYAARVKLETAKAELDRTIEEISRIQAELAPIRGCEQEYQKTLRDKRSQLQAAGGRAAEEIFQIEETYRVSGKPGKRGKGSRICRQECAADKRKNPFQLKQRRKLEYLGFIWRRPLERYGKAQRIRRCPETGAESSGRAASL